MNVRRFTAATRASSSPSTTSTANDPSVSLQRDREPLLHDVGHVATGEGRAEVTVDQPVDVVQVLHEERAGPGGSGP